MLPLDKFRNNIGRNFAENDNIGELIFSLSGESAKQYVSQIYTNGAESTLNDILSTISNDEIIQKPKDLDPNNYDSFQKDDKMIIWSKSGQEPFIGIYDQSITEDNNMEDFLSPETNVDREAVESAGYFMARGLAEDTFGSLVDEACKEVTSTEEAIDKLKSIMKDNESISGRMYTDEEQKGFDSFRHGIREKMFSFASKDLMPNYDDDPKKVKMQGLQDPIGDFSSSWSDDGLEEEMGSNPMAQRKVADAREDLMSLEQEKADLHQQILDLEKQIADKNEEIAKASEDLGGPAPEKTSPMTGTGEPNSLLQEVTTEINKGALINAHAAGGPQAFANEIASLDQDRFIRFLNSIDKEGYNILGNATKSELQNPDQVSDTEVSPEVANTELGQPGPEPEQKLAGL